MDRPIERMLTTAQAASELGVHERTVRRYVSLGLLAYRRLPGGHYRISETAVEDFWRANDGAGQSATRPPRGRASRRAGRAQARRRTGKRRMRPSDAKPHGPYDLSNAVLDALRAERM